MPAQQPLHRGSLHAPTAAMNQPHLAESRLVRRMQIVVHDVHDVPRRKAVKVYRLFDGDLYGLVVFHWPLPNW